MRGSVTLTPISLNLLKPYSALLVTYCAEKNVSARLCAGSASAQMVGQEEVGGVTCRVLCSWWLLGLGLKGPGLGPGGLALALTNGQA